MHSKGYIAVYAAIVAAVVFPAIGGQSCQCQRVDHQACTEHTTAVPAKNNADSCCSIPENANDSNSFPCCSSCIQACCHSPQQVLILNIERTVEPPTLLNSPILPSAWKLDTDISLVVQTKSFYDTPALERLCRLNC